MKGRSKRYPLSAFTLVELLVAMSVFGLFMSGLLAMWSSLGMTALNTTSYAQLQNDQLRVLDYLKRDIRRATKVELYDGGTLVTASNVAAPQLRLTVPDYYADTREEDNTSAGRSTNPPTLAAGEVVYGTALGVRYHATGGVALREEGGVLRRLSNAGGFAVSFVRETSGAIRCQVLFDGRMRGSGNRRLQRRVEGLFVPRLEFRL